MMPVCYLKGMVMAPSPPEPGRRGTCGRVAGRRPIPAVLIVVALAVGGSACTHSTTVTQQGGHSSSPATSSSSTPSGNGAPFPTNPEQKITVTNISPTAGTAGEVVVITGQKLSEVTAVCFGGIPVSELSPRTDSQISVHAPTGSGTLLVTLIVPRSRFSPVAAGDFTYQGSATESPSPLASPPCSAGRTPAPSP